MKNTFIFYRSFLDAIRTLPDADQLKMFNAVADYALDQKEPELEGTVKGFWMLMKPNIEANNKRYENGKKGAEHGVKGGRPKKDETPDKPQNNPKETPNPENKTPDKDKDKDKDKIVKEKFNEFRKNYPGTKRGLDVEYEVFIKKNPREDVDLLLPALKREIAYKERLSKDGKFCPEWKNLKTWINNKSWTEEYPTLFTDPAVGVKKTVMCEDRVIREVDETVVINGEEKRVGRDGKFVSKW